MKAFIALLLTYSLFAASVSLGQDLPKVYIGEISDSQCAFKVHSNSGGHIEMLQSGMWGNTPAECTRSCVNAMGGQYVLVTLDSKEHTRNVYSIQEQQKVANFAGKKVKITGVFDPKTKKLHILTIELMS